MQNWSCSHSLGFSSRYARIGNANHHRLARRIPWWLGIHSTWSVCSKPAQLCSILVAQEEPSKTRDLAIIGIHPMKNGLFRISLSTSTQRSDLVHSLFLNERTVFRLQSTCASIPLIDGMLLPLHILSFFLRQAVHSLNRRKRLEDSQRSVDGSFLSSRPLLLSSSQTAYSLRKSRISKIIAKYLHRSNHLDEFFQHIFFSSSRAVTPAVDPTLAVQSWPVRCPPSFSSDNKKNSVSPFSFVCLPSFAHQNSQQWRIEPIRISLSLLR